MGYRSADARLLFFENEKVYCKLTVGCRGWNLQLLVSFGTLGSWSFAVLKWGIALHELKKQPFSANQKVFFCRKLYASPSKASRFRNQNTACSNNFLLSAKTAFFTYKSLSFAQAFPCRFQKPPIFTNQMSCFYPNFFLFPPKTFFFCPLPIPTALNLLSAKISHFYKPKAFYSHKPFLIAIQSNPFPPSASHSHHP